MSSYKSVSRSRILVALKTVDNVNSAKRVVQTEAINAEQTANNTNYITHRDTIRMNE